MLSSLVVERKPKKCNYTDVLVHSINILTLCPDIFWSFQICLEYSNNIDIHYCINTMNISYITGSDNLFAKELKIFLFSKYLDYHRNETIDPL